jgi:hypothetical protein
MMFLAIVKYSHGGKVTHEFRCPLERKAFVDGIRQKDPAARIKLRQRKEIDEAVPQDEAQWYGGGA